MRAAILIAALLAPDAGVSRADQGITETMREADLTGEWTREQGENCAERYPRQLHLRAGGTYLAPEGVADGALWHGGDWELSERTLRVQAANDAMLSYQVVALEDGRLTLLDSQGCRVVYARLR